MRDRGLGAADLARGEVVVGELAGRRARGLERLAGAQVQPRPPGVGGRVVERLAHERVPEGEAVGVLGVLAHDARRAGPPRARRAGPPPAARPSPRAGRGRSRGRGRRRRSASRPSRAASRASRRETRSLTPSGTPGGSSGASARLRSISSMKNGLPAVRPWRLRASSASPTSSAVSASVQARERHALDDVLAAEVGEQPRGRADGVGLRVAQRDEHHQRRAVQAADDVAQQQQRRAARPLEVLDHEQQRALAGRLAEQRGDRLEQPVAAVLALAGRRARARRSPRRARAPAARAPRRRSPGRGRPRARRSGAAPPRTAGRAPRSPRRCARAGRPRRPRAPRRRSGPPGASCPCPPRRPPRRRRPRRPACSPSAAAAPRARARGRRTGARRAARGRPGAAAPRPPAPARRRAPRPASAAGRAGR